MSGPEAKLEAACVKYAKSKGWLHAKLDPKGNVGVPDHVFFGRGALFPVLRLVEFKAGKNVLTAKQRAWVERYADLYALRDPGDRLNVPHMRVHVIRTLEEFKELIG